MGQEPPNCFDENLRDSLLQLPFSHSSFSSVVVRPLTLFGRLLLPCCRSSLAFPSRISFELLNSPSPMMEYLYSFSVRYRSIAATIRRRFVIVHVLLTNCCVKLLKDFVQGLRFVLFNAFVITLLSSPRLPDHYPLFVLCKVLFFIAFSLKLCIQT